MLLFLAVKMVEVENVYVYGNHVILSDRSGRMMVMGVGDSEAFSISVALSGNGFWRPLSHDLMVQILRISEIKPERVEIYGVKDGAYLARIHLVRRRFLWFKEKVLLDSRPSDAIALALRMGVPVFVNDSLLMYPEQMLPRPDTLRHEGEGIEG